MTIGFGWRLGIVTGAIALICSEAHGQPTDRAAGVGLPAARAEAGAVPPIPLAPKFSIPLRDSAWWVPLASAAIPGYGQKLLGQNRFVAYLAVEAYALTNHLSSQAASDREVRRYRVLARDVARAFFAGNQQVGDWDYYEWMEKRIESGVYDRTPGTGIFSPEVNEKTLNGEIWLRARQLSNWPDLNVEPPRASGPYNAAISYYAAHAIKPEYRWSWRNAQLEWDLYRQTIRRANESSRDARQYLAAMVFNHVLSTIDAYVTLRLHGGAGANRNGFSLVGSFPVR